MKKVILSLLLMSVFTTQGYAIDTYYVPGESPKFRFDVLTDEESLYAMGDEMDAAFDLPYPWLNSLFKTATDWTNAIKTTPYEPVPYYVIAVSDFNAFAASPYVSVEEIPYKVTYVNALMNNLTVTTLPEELEEDGFVGFVGLGLGVSFNSPGWSGINEYSALYHNSIPDLYVVTKHEIMHSLGVSSQVRQFNEDEGDKTYYFSEDESDPLSVYDKNLRVYTGTGPVFDEAYEVVPQPGMSVGEGEEFDVKNYSPYFVGENTLKVLAGEDDYDAARTAIINNGGLKNYSEEYLDSEDPNTDNYPYVLGLPIHPSDEDDIDLSHLELRNSYMSHQEYRNWLVPMEAELALLKDIGYTNINLKDYFGKSYYLNNIDDTFTAGFNGTKNQAVGIHVYGNENNIKLAGTIKNSGEGSFGVRIDGSENTFTVKSGSNINSDGKNNIALGATWGHDHIINVEEGSEITARGENGIAVSFDFGENMFGSGAGAQKGSYLNYDPDFNISEAPEAETAGALVKEFNIEGSLDGEKAAIYISDKAYVKNINIKDGATINGDIKSEWNSFTTEAGGEIQKLTDEGEWEARDPEDVNDVLPTDLNFSGTVKVNGSIDGENEVLNTLLLSNDGDLTVSGETVAVADIDNSGSINFDKSTELSSVSGEITNNGQINVKSNAELELADNIETIENTVNLENNSYFSTMNDSVKELSINKLNSDNAKIAIDLGDTLNIENDSDAGLDNISLVQVNVSEETAETLDDVSDVKMFEDDSALLTVTGSANVYYNGNKYTMCQDTANPGTLTLAKTGVGTELADAAADATSGNYIVTEDALTKDIGVINGSNFQISGKDIDVNSNKGMIVDGIANENGTILKTGISGASDSNITVKNGGKLLIDDSDKTITVGAGSETAIAMNNGNVLINAGTNGVNIEGSIKGTNNATDKIDIAGKTVDLNKTDKVSINSTAGNLNINGASTNTNWTFTGSNVNIPDESFIGADGTNSLTLDGGTINTQNGKAADIFLSKLDLKQNTNVVVDVDMATMQADRFVFANPNDVVTDGAIIMIDDINLMNPNQALTAPGYEIKFVAPEYNNQNLTGYISSSFEKQIMTPIFKYALSFDNTPTGGNIVVERAAGGGYRDYNPAVYTAPVAAQTGGLLTQLASYDFAFNGLDMFSAMPKSERQAMKTRNKYASAGADVMTYDPNQNPQEGKGVWFKPYSTFEHIDMKKGPKVKNTAYGSYFGGDSEILELKNGWDGVISGYAGYNGSHQNFDGNSVYQNGGTLGVTGMFYKDNFFTGITANVGSSVADASTMYGKDDIVLLTSGVASKTGYNFGFNDDKFIIQPNFLMSYTFVNTFDYTNAAGVRINSDPLNSIQLSPGLKFIGNFKNGWQPYFGVQMIWNIMDKSKFTANEAELEQIGVRPYVQYGVGVQKQIGERCTGYIQSMVRNGGRRGVSLSAGFRWKI